jgi:hypothetical protein
MQKSVYISVIVIILQQASAIITGSHFPFDDKQTLSQSSNGHLYKIHSIGPKLIEAHFLHLLQYQLKDDFVIASVFYGA